MTDSFDLDRFVVAQAPIYTDALAEIRAGRKRTHWMWFVFPQIAGLGSSPAARHFAIRSIAEARAYLAHHLLGPRLCDGVIALTRIDDADATAVFGPIDAMKLRSSLTLFSVAAPHQHLFAEALDRWFGDAGPDAATLGILERQGRDP